MLEPDMREIVKTLCMSPMYWKYPLKDRYEMCKEVKSLWKDMYKEPAGILEKETD